jgi:hypothetical protein
LRKRRILPIHGTPLEKVRAIVKTFDPNIVGVTLPFSAQSSNVEAIDEVCKQINPNILLRH